MSKLPSTPIYNISRVAFQLILHQALTKQAEQNFFGLLGCAENHKHTIEKVTVLTAVSQIDTALQQWRKADIICVGVFQMQGVQLTDEVKKMMPNCYVDLAVKLDEKGRLDLLAQLCNQSENIQTVLPLCLIEDGQQVTYA
ncbi:MAG: hypothetical protein Q9M75_02390 [Ghiorsea sp.]|nr:hypothetical protein [Ghiorsea sp.]MDQ7059495.1 hypothetical protein [Ghiorsea sp.]